MRKTILLPLALIFIGTTALAQNEGRWYNGDWVQIWEYSSVSKETREKIKASGVKSEEAYRTTKKGEILTQATTFDEEGRITSANKKHWNKNKYRKHTYKYNDEGLISKIEKTDYKGNAYLVTEYKYNKDQHRTLFVQSTMKKGETKKIESGYNGDQLIWRKSYLKGNTTPQQNWTYEYYEDNSRKETKYFKKGKLKYTYHYDCKPEGEIQETKHKDTSVICIREELDPDGNTVKYMQTTNDKNEVVTNRNVYTPEGKLIAGSSKGKDGSMRYWWEKKNNVHHYKYYRKGKLYYENFTTYDDNNNRLKYEYISHKKPKWNRKTVYEYDSNGLLTKESNYDHEGEIRYTARFVREFYN